MDVDFAKVGEAFGAYGEKVSDPAQVPAAIERLPQGGAWRPDRDPARLRDEAVGGSDRHGSTT
jgi:hypothetical protein